MRKTGVIAGIAVAVAMPAAAQEPGTLERMTIEAKAQIERARAPVESRITRGAPYSAEAVTETLQVLADGNRIARRSVTRIYRDSEGRTRRETVSPSGDVVTVNISDPVGESQYVLDPRTKVAHRTGVIMATAGGAAAQPSLPEDSARWSPPGRRRAAPRLKRGTTRRNAASSKFGARSKPKRRRWPRRAAGVAASPSSTRRRRPRCGCR
jgi:hypothetical protein